MEEEFFFLFSSYMGDAVVKGINSPLTKHCVKEYESGSLWRVTAKENPNTLIEYWHYPGIQGRPVWATWYWSDGERLTELTKERAFSTFRALEKEAIEKLKAEYKDHFDKNQFVWFLSTPHRILKMDSEGALLCPTEGHRGKTEKWLWNQILGWSITEG